MDLDRELKETMKAVPECVAAAYIDMTTGMLLSVKTLDSHPQEVLDMVAAATADLFQGSTVVHIEDSFKKSRGNDAADRHYFQEFLVFSDNLLHVFMRTKKYQDHVVCFVCRKSANVGMVLAKSRMVVEKLSETV